MIIIAITMIRMRLQNLQTGLGSIEIPKIKIRLTHPLNLIEFNL